MSPRPDAAQREAARQVEQHRRMREIEETILARTPEHMPEPTLWRVARCMELLGDPQRTFPIVHLTGTNGKTSTARIIEQLLREAGLSTGRFTSPHLHDIRERISLNGKPITRERFIDTWDDIATFVEIVDAESEADGGPRMTYFEVLTVLAYAAFADAPIDVGIIEVGLGGVWDATNVADASVAVITPVAVDHTRLLGDTLELIATEKRGIIKPGSIAVVARQEREVDELLAERIAEVGAGVRRADQDFAVTEREPAVGGQVVTVQGLAATYADLFVPLFGEHQAHNTALAIAAVEAFLGGGEQPIEGEILEAGLAAVTSPGRLEIVRRSPTVLVDAAHNLAGARALREALNDSFTFTRLVGVVGILQEKDADAILETLEPVLDHVVITRSTSPRAVSPNDLGRAAEEIFGEGRVTIVRDLPDALDTAAELADEGGVGGGVLATGSVVTAAEVRMLLGVGGDGAKDS